MEVKKGDVIAVWFSCGAASAVALQETIAQYGDIATIRAVNSPIREEDEDNQRFAEDVGRWLNIKIERAVSKKYPNQSCVEVWEDRKFMSSPYGAPCTQELKKKVRQEWEKENHVDWHVLGFTYEEKDRYDRFVLTERENVLPVLISKKITKVECYIRLIEAGVSLPRIYRLGYPNANCIGCVKATSPTYWNHVRKQHPEVFKERAEQSRRIGAMLVKYKGKRIFLDELDPNAQGLPMRDMDFECGIFCEERPVKQESFCED